MRRHKYGAIPTTVDGIRFASKKESERYQGLKMLQLAGAISGLELQPRFDLCAPCVCLEGPSLRGCPRCDGMMEVKIATYVADFTYVNMSNGEVVVEDVKGMLTAMYRLKKRWIEAQCGITITEV